MARRHAARKSSPIKRRLQIQRLEHRHLLAATLPDDFVLELGDSAWGHAVLERRDAEAFSTDVSRPGNLPDVQTEFIATRRITVEPGQTYRLEADASSPIDGVPVRISVMPLDADGQPLANEPLRLNLQTLRPSPSIGSQRTWGLQLAAVTSRLAGPDTSGIAGDALTLPPGTTQVEFVANKPLINARLIPENETSHVATFDTRTWVAGGVSLQTIRTDQTFPVDAGGKTILSLTAAVRHTTDESLPRETHSIGYEALDAKGNVIRSEHVQRFAGAMDTRLASPVQPGDTRIVLLDATGWSTSLDPSTRTLAWFPDTVGLRDASPAIDLTYTRQTANDPVDGLWRTDGVTGNVLTLSRPWSGPRIAAGTTVRNAVAGQSLWPVLLDDQSLSGTPMRLTSPSIGGFWRDGVPNLEMFPPGTDSIRPAARLNQSVLGSDDTVTLSAARVGSAAPTTVAASAGVFTVDLDVLANDAISQNAVGVELVGVGPGSFGAIAVSGDRVRVVMPPDFIGTDRFEYTVRDIATGEMFTQRASLTIAGVDASGGGPEFDPRQRPPVAIEITAAGDGRTRQGYRTAAGQPLVADGVGQLRLTFNDIVGPASNQTINDPDDGLVGLADPPRHGSLQVHTDGTFTYIPDDGFVGVDSFRYLLSDGARVDDAIAWIDVLPDADAVVEANLRAVVAGTQDFQAKFKRLPGDVYDSSQPDAQPRLSWRVHMLAQLGFRELHSQFRFDEPWDSAHNLPLAAMMPDVFGDGDGASTSLTRVQALSSPRVTIESTHGQVGFREEIWDFKYRDVPDGLDRTIFLVHSTPELAMPWTAPEHLSFDSDAPRETVGGIPDDGLLFATYSGNVDRLPATVDDDVFTALVTTWGFPVEPIVDLNAILRADDPVGFDANGLRQDAAMLELVRASTNYHDAFKRYPPSLYLQGQPDGTPFLSWRVYLLPFISRNDLWSQFRKDEPWDSPHNLALSAEMPDIFRSVGDAPDSTTTRMKVVTGPNSIYPVDADGSPLPSQMRDVTDGLANTLFMVETGADQAVLWTKPDEFVFDPADPVAALGNLDGDFFRAVTASGEVLHLPADIDADRFLGMLTSNAATSGGMIPPSEWTPLDRSPDIGRPLETLQTRPQYRRLEEIWSAIHDYNDDFNQYPGTHVREHFDEEGKPLVSWRVDLLPMLGYQALYDQFRLDEPWDSAHNLPLLDFMPDVFRSWDASSESTVTPVQRLVSDFPADPNAPRETIFSTRFRPTRFRDVLDGLSNTIQFVETSPDHEVPWTQPSDVLFDPADPMARLIHPDGFQRLNINSYEFRLPGTVGEMVAQASPNNRDGYEYTELITMPTSLVVTEGELLALHAHVFSRERVVEMTVTVDFVDPNLLSVSTTGLQFDQPNYDQTQAITFLAIDDNVHQPPRTTTILVGGESFTITILDNDPPGNRRSRQAATRFAAPPWSRSSDDRSTRILVGVDHAIDGSLAVSRKHRAALDPGSIVSSAAASGRTPKTGISDQASPVPVVDAFERLSPQLSWRLNAL